MELKKKDDGYWHVGYETERGYQWKNTKATSRDAAEGVVALAKIAEIEMAAKASALSGAVLSSIMTGRKINCATVLEEWCEWRKMMKAPNTIQSQAYIVAKFLNTFGLGNKLINRVDETQIDAFVNAEDAGSAATRASRLAAVRSYFAYASAKSYLFGSPAKLVEVNHRILTHDQKEAKVRMPFTEEEYRKVVAGTEGFFRYATALSYWSGLRLSDCANLEWGSLRGTEIVSWTRKRNARVALPLDDPLIGGGELDLIILEMVSAIPKRGQTARLLFPQEAAFINNPITNGRLSTYYGRILDRLGIKGKTFHCLRHSFATRLAKAGKTEQEIGRLIGHSDVETTKGYIHS